MVIDTNIYVELKRHFSDLGNESVIAKSDWIDYWIPVLKYYLQDRLNKLVSQLLHIMADLYI